MPSVSPIDDMLHEWGAWTGLLQAVNAELVAITAKRTDADSAAIVRNAHVLDLAGQTIAAALRAWYLWTQARLPEARDLVRQTLELGTSMQTAGGKNGTTGDDARMIALSPLFTLFPALERNPLARQHTAKLAQIMQWLAAGAGLISPDPALQVHALLSLILAKTTT